MLYKVLALTIAVLFCSWIVLCQNNKQANRTHVWAGITVNHPLYTEGWTDEMVNEFAVFNDGGAPAAVNACIDNSTFVINGVPLSGNALQWFHFNLSNGPRAIDPLPAGKGTYISKGGFGQIFAKAGVYTVIWKSDCFESQPLTFRVMPH